MGGGGRTRGATGEGGKHGGGEQGEQRGVGEGGLGQRIEIN